MQRILPLVTSVVALLGMTSLSVSAQDVVETMSKTGVLHVAVQTQGPPISFVDKNGQRTGLAVEIVKGLAEASGLTLDLLDYDWKGLIPAVLSKKADFIAADMTPTQKRALKLNFTIPIFYSEVLSISMNNKGFKSWRDLNKQGVSIGVVQASSYVDMVKNFMPNATLKEFAGGGPSVAQAVASGRVDAAVMDRGGAMQYVKVYPGMQILDDVIRKEPLAFALRPDETHLLQYLNNYIRFIQTDGELDRLLAYWWNSTAWEKDHK
ncbi:MAG TPA: amino acid ABC transporter substrate-binding protein [Gammaproteobacteria bacterium]|nr:amino acid ABC transporter substrate-binding protein [Gammaproteobacteria bacterium]